MLSVIDVAPVCDCHLLMDAYIPLWLRCSKSTEVPIYWRTGNFDTSLLEIGLDSEKGMICAITLTSIDPDRFVVEETPIRAVSSVFGMPIFDIIEWKDDLFKEEYLPFSVVIGRNSLTIFLGSKETCLQTTYDLGPIMFGVSLEPEVGIRPRMYGMGKVVLGTNSSSQLCYLLFDGINEKELDSLHERVMRGS